MSPKDALALLAHAPDLRRVFIRVPADIAGVEDLATDVLTIVQMCDVHLVLTHSLHDKMATCPNITEHVTWWLVQLRTIAGRCGISDSALLIQTNPESWNKENRGYATITLKKP